MEKRKIAEFRLELDLMRTTAWNDFNKSPEAKVYWFLFPWIVRAPVNSGGWKLYEDYFMDGKLVARWSQENMAAHLRVSKKTIITDLNSLAKKKFIVKLKKTVHQKTGWIYQFGTHDFHGNEEYFIEKILRKSRVIDFELRGTR